MNKGGFSFKRLMGISGAKYRLARFTGIPTTKGGRKRKIGNILAKLMGIK